MLLIIIVLGFFLSKCSPDSKSPSSSSSPVQSATDIKQQQIYQVTIKKLNWSKGGFDNVMMVNATFENKGTVDVKDLELTCEHYSNSGTKIDSNSRVIYEVVKAGKSKSIRNFNMGFIHSQAASTNCRITDLAVQ